MHCLFVLRAITPCEPSYSHLFLGCLLVMPLFPLWVRTSVDQFRRLVVTEFIEGAHDVQEVGRQGGIGTEFVRSRAGFDDQPLRVLKRRVRVGIGIAEKQTAI